MPKSRRIRCSHCDSLEVYKRGTRSGVFRFQCKVCKRYFTSRRKDISASNRFVWFRQWVEYGHTVEYISKRSRYSQRTLKRYFYDYLSRYPTWRIRPSEKVNLLIDGTYFANKVCLVLYQDNNVKATQLYRPYRWRVV